MRPTADEMMEWLRQDVAKRQDCDGRPVKRGRRRLVNGNPVLVHSRKILQPDAPPDMWGICYQNGDKRVMRGSDEVYRMTLAAAACKKEGRPLKDAYGKFAVGETGDPFTKSRDGIKSRVRQYAERWKNEQGDIWAWPMRELAF